MLHAIISAIITKLFSPFLRKIKNAPFDKVRKNKYEEFILREHPCVRYGALIMLGFFFMGLLYSVYMILYKSDYSGIYISALGVIFASSLTYAVYADKLVINNDGITKCRLFFKKHIDFYCIKDAKYSWLFGGSCIITDGKTKICIPIELRGFNEFFQILKTKISEEKCRVISVELQNRKFASNDYYFK